MSERKPVKLDLGGFKPKTKENPDTAQSEDVLAVKAGQRLGFTAGVSAPKIDGRTLRRKGKLQTNMKLSEHVRRDFLQLTQKFVSSDECLAYLLGLHEEKTRISGSS